MAADPQLLSTRQDLPMRAESLPTGWLALRHCRLADSILPLILLHPALGVAIIGGPVDGVALLRARLAEACFEAIFPGRLPILRLDQVADPTPALAALPPLTLPGGDAWVGVVRRALESVPKPALVAPRRRGARQPHLRRRLEALGGAVGLAMLAGVAGWMTTLPPAAMRPVDLARLALPADPIAVPEPATGKAQVLGEPVSTAPFGIAAALPRLPEPVAPATAIGEEPPGEIATALPDSASTPFEAADDQPVLGLAEAAPGSAEPVVPVADALPSPAATMAAESLTFTASATPPALDLPPAPALAAPATALPWPAATGLARIPSRSTPQPRIAPHEPDQAAIRPAAASGGLPGRCRAIIQRLQIGDMVADGDIRLLKRGCTG